ncbi:MAG: hypothetical protein WC942_11250, partial [Clostridia bacterium]
EGDPQNVESLFIPSDKVKVLTPMGKQILSYKTDFLSNKIYSRIMGYSNGEWRKAMAIQVIPKKRTKTEVEILGELWNIFGDLDKEQKDRILYLLYENREKEIISSIAGLGKKRKEQVKNYGYCSKSASHAIRLVQEVKELMETGEITFPRYNASLLKDIRYGKIDKK